MKRAEGGAMEDEAVVMQYGRTKDVEQEGGASHMKSYIKS